MSYAPDSRKRGSRIRDLGGKERRICGVGRKMGELRND
jgi:hypothetical protein